MAATRDGPAGVNRQGSCRSQMSRVETTQGVLSSSMPIRPATLFEEAGSSSTSTTISCPLMMCIIVPPRAMISYLFQSLVLTYVSSSVRFPRLPSSRGCWPWTEFTTWPRQATMPSSVFSESNWPE